MTAPRLTDAQRRELQRATSTTDVGDLGDHQARVVLIRRGLMQLTTDPTSEVNWELTDAGRAALAAAEARS